MMPVMRAFCTICHAELQVCIVADHTYFSPGCPSHLKARIGWKASAPVPPQTIVFPYGLAGGPAPIAKPDPLPTLAYMEETTQGKNPDVPTLGLWPEGHVPDTVYLQTLPRVSCATRQFLEGVTHA